MQTPHSSLCPSCGFESPAGFRFCGQCGGALAAAAPAPANEAQQGERRHLSVMFCDLVASTALSSELDPEDLRDTVRAYQQTCSRIVERYGGSIAQFLGDGILAYFGVPVAHEDDARRATLAGLEIAREVPTLSRRVNRRGGDPLAVRVGIHTGDAVVGEVGAGDRRENLAVGQTPNIAARLQALAAPGQVVVSEATCRLLRGYFQLESAGSFELKGVTQPVDVWIALASTEGRGPGGRAAANLSPLVGRERKLALLDERWKKVVAGQGQVVMLRGEAGIGKSRLVSAMRDRLRDQPHTLWELQSASYQQNSAFHPLIEAIHRRLQGRASASSATEGTETAELERQLADAGLDPAVALPLLAPLLSLALPAPLEPPALPPAELRQKTLETLVEWVLRQALRRPVLFIAEDLHWMDPSTIEFLRLLAQAAAGNAMLVLLAYRPSFEPGWSDLGHAVEVSINRLIGADASRLVRTFPQAESLPDEVVAELVEKSDGNPLFLEELTRTWLEAPPEQQALTSDTGELTLRHLGIPHRLHDSLLARLDRLGPAKEVAQLGATLGRSFRFELLLAVAQQDESALSAALERLVDADLLVPEGEGTSGEFRFRHALFQEAAYQSLLRSRRRRYHQQIVLALEQRFPEVVAGQPALLAHHATEAALEGKALAYWQTAGQRAVARSANLEALRHLRTALELLERQPRGSDRDRRELELQITLAPALMATEGFAAPAVERAYERARSLAGSASDRELAHAALHGLLRFATARGDFRRARELAGELLTLAAAGGEGPVLAEASWTLGSVLFYLGEPAEAMRHLATASAFFDGRHPVPQAFLHTVHPAISCRVFSAYAFWLLGRGHQARATARENLELARTLDHPMSRAMAHLAAALVETFLRQPRAVLDEARIGIALAEEHRIPHWREMGKVLLGWALCEDGEGDRGLELLRDGLAGWKASGIGFGHPLFAALLAEQELLRGSSSRVEALLDAALAAAEQTGEIYYTAELHRLRGELSLWRGGPDAELVAEEQFERGLRVARHQGAVPLYLRAALTLANLKKRQGRAVAAIDELAAALAAAESSSGSGPDGTGLAEAASARAWLDAIKPRALEVAIPAAPPAVLEPTR